MIFLGQAASYSAGRAFRHLFVRGTERDSEELKIRLAKKYGAEPEDVALYHSGRSALAAGFLHLVRPGAPVFIPGLTCIAVVRAVRAAKMRPVFVDIVRDGLGYNFKELEKAIKAHQNDNKTTKNVKNTENTDKSIDKKGKVCYNGIIVVQNTLGNPDQIDKIAQLAEKYQLAIVEDLAHSAGRKYRDQSEIGTHGVATVLSFGKGKAIDTITGGALILRRKSSDFMTLARDKGALKQPQRAPGAASCWRDRWYPLFGVLTRRLWPIGVGKPLLGTLVRLHWIEKSADTALDTEVRLGHWQAKLALEQLDQLPETPLRECAFVSERSKVLKRLEQEGYRFDEIWYDAPVSPARYQAEADFPEAECPETVRIAAEIINLPVNVRPERLMRAREIIEKYQINQEKEGKCD